MIVIYLVGQMTNDIRTYSWRSNIESAFYNNDNYSILNPCNSLVAKKLLKSEVFIPEKIIVPHDRQCVKKSDIIIANMEQYDKTRSLLGSFFELAWAYEQPHTTVIGIKPKDLNSINYTHPFIQATVHTWVDSVDEVCNLIKNYYF